VSTYVHSIHFTTWLPEELADTGTLSTHAANLATHATTINTTYTETQRIWTGDSGIGDYIGFDGDDEVINSFSTNCEALGSAAYEGLNAISQALETFASDVSEFRTAVHTPLKGDVAAFNALPANEYTDDEKATLAGAGQSVGTTRTAAARAALVSRLTTARDTYAGHVDACVASIEGSSPAAVPIDAGITMAVINNVQKSYNLATTWVGRAGDLKSFKGKMGFLWEADAPSLSQLYQAGTPAWMKVHDPDSWIGTFLPQSFKDRIPNVDDLSRQGWWKAADKRYAGFLNGMEGIGKQFWLGTLATLPPGVLGWLEKQKGRTGNFVSMNSKVDRKTGTIKMKWSLNPGRNMTKGERQWLKRFDKLDQKLETFQKGKGGKFLDGAGKVVGVLDTGMTYYDSYTDSYNEALRETPNASEEEIRTEALTSMAIEGTAENLGRVAGGVVGRTAGAALGQAVIPIPGVGAAVGGFVGGLIGESVGGTIGKGVGEFVNDWRKDGIGNATANAAESVSNAVGNVGESIGNVAKDVGKGVLEVLGWG
jgi:hypothetical protein